MPPIPRLRIWNHSINFDHEINWQDLCLVLSDWRVMWISLLEKFFKSFIFLVPLLLKQKILLVFPFPFLYSFLILIIIRAKVEFSVWFKMMGCSRVSSICVGIVNLLLVKCRQGLSNCIKNPHCFVSVSFYV